MGRRSDKLVNETFGLLRRRVGLLSVLVVHSLVALGCAGTYVPMNPETEMQFSRIIGDELFRCWASDYMYNIGLSDGHGIYIRGPDDTTALTVFNNQFSAPTSGVPRDQWRLGLMWRADALERVKVKLKSGEEVVGERMRMHVKDFRSIAIKSGSEVYTIGLDEVQYIQPVPANTKLIGCTADPELMMGRLVKRW